MSELTAGCDNREDCTDMFKHHKLKINIIIKDNNINN